MTERFEVGEVAIYVRPGSPYYGQEVTVESGLENVGMTLDHVTGEYVYHYLVYKIGGPNIPPFGSAKPEWLRKKKPPSRECDQLTSWDKCEWRPEVLTV